MSIFTDINMKNKKITYVANPTNAQDAATKNYVDTHLASGLGTVTSPINMNGNEITGLPTSITSLSGDSSSISKKVFLDVMSDALVLRVSKSGDTMSGNLDMVGNSILHVVDPTNAQDVATKNYADTNLALKLNKTGGAMTGNLIMGGYFINNIHDPMLNNDAVTLGYLNNNFAKLTAGGNMNMNAYNITNLASPINTADAATRGYVDNNYVNKSWRYYDWKSNY